MLRMFNARNASISVSDEQYRAAAWPSNERAYGGIEAEIHSLQSARWCVL